MRRRSGSGITIRQLHRRGAPADDVARAVFDAAEQARVEALGARAMDGVRANLARLTEMRMKTDPLTRARSREEVPLGSAIGLMIRERLTGRGAARGRARRPGLRPRLDRGESRRRSRRARPRARRPAGLRASHHQGAARPRTGRGRGGGRVRSRRRRGRRGRRPVGGRRRRQEGRGRGRRPRRGRDSGPGAGGRRGAGRQRLVRGGARRGQRQPWRGRRGGDAARSARTGRFPICRRASTIASSRAQYDEADRRRPSCATRRNLGGCAPISTSSSPTCRARSPSSPTGCSAG